MHEWKVIFEAKSNEAGNKGFVRVEADADGNRLVYVASADGGPAGVVLPAHEAVALAEALKGSTNARLADDVKYLRELAEHLDRCIPILSGIDGPVHAEAIRHVASRISVATND